MSVRKKQVTSPPARFTVKDNQYSPRNAVQEAFMSDTSLGNNVQEEYQMNAGNNFYSPAYRQEVSSSFNKKNSPRNKPNTNLTNDRKRSSNQKQSVLQNQRDVVRSNPANNLIASTTYPYNPPYTGSTLNIQPGLQQPYQHSGESLVPSPQFLIGSQEPTSSRDEEVPIKSAQYDIMNRNDEDYVNTYPNGDHYSGSKRGKYLQGYGVYDFTNQNLQYRGYFKQSKMHGAGTLVRKPAGAMTKQQIIYEGEWMNGRKQGFGTYFYNHNKYYKGNWIDNVKQGRGLYKQPEGQYDGNWKNNMKHGDGRLTMANGTEIVGWWEDDKFLRGTIIYSNGDKYQGDLRQFNREGYGIYNYASNGGQYRGPWQNGYKHGENAQINFKNGDQYKGSVFNNKLEGCNGYYKWSNPGDYINAEFVNDMPVRGTIMVKKDNKQYNFDLSRKTSSIIR